MLLQRPKLPLLCCGCGGGVTSPSLPASPPGEQTPSTAEVEAMTAGFTSAVVGEGGFSTVYLARLSGGSKSQVAAVKVHCSCSERLRRAIRQEMDALLRVRHPHIVRLLAFCDQRDEGVLVLEFAPNGNLHEKLHDRCDGKVAVALQVARELEYLHDRCEPQVVHGDVKASNVLLGAAMHARLCDFGSALTGFSAIVRWSTSTAGAARWRCRWPARGSTSTAGAARARGASGRPGTPPARSRRSGAARGGGRSQAGPGAPPIRPHRGAPASAA